MADPKMAKGRCFRQGSVDCNGAGNDEGNNPQDGFNEHSAIANRKHILFIEMVLEEVPEETRLWKPETAPQAMVTKRMGKRGLFATVKPLKAGILMVGLPTRIPTTPARIMPRSRKTLR